MKSPHEDFFVGWADRVPLRQGGFLARVGLGFLAVMLLMALGLARTMDDAGGGAGEWGAGEQTLRGVVTSSPYALLHLPPDAAHPKGHVVMLTMTGKYPVVVPDELDGKGIEAKGWLIRRGSMDMLQMTAEPVAAVVETAPVAVEKLGRWRITGEVCDGQCYVGLMRPGTGIAHRACANFCLMSGVPPVFVSTAPVAGTSFLVLADAAGGPVGDAMYDYVGLRVRLDGEVERRGDVLVFRADFRTAHVP